MRLKELLDCASPDTLIRYMLKEVEDTWRRKFGECKEVLGKEVDQLMMIVDMKGSKLKDLSNKQANVVFKTLLIELQRFYPGLLSKCFVLNVPMFFEGFFESEVKPHLSEVTLQKIVLSGENTHSELLELVPAANLPKIYGGEAECEATCVYADKGPWADVENKVNY